MSASDTIVALSTPPGRSGIGVIRLSGQKSLEILRTLVRENQFSPEPSRATLKSLCDPETSEELDQSLVTYFKAPHSFTGEDVVELSCHGSPVLLSRLLDLILQLNARAAGAGEFTLRAVRNGKINLTQAEAIRDLINAQTEAALTQAARQMRGELSFRLQPLKDALLDIIVLLESSLEFVEDDLPELAAGQLQVKIASLIDNLSQLSATFRSGRLLREGLKVTLAGRPNVGKSSLFNSLLLIDRAIVTDIPGTTRDSLSELVNIRGTPVLLTDTAGVQPSDDKIESLGIERTRRAMGDADLVLVVLDGSQPLFEEDFEILAEVKEQAHLIALNKKDLESFKFTHKEPLKGSSRVIEISAQTGIGLDALQDAILEPFASRDTHDVGLLITDARHFDLLQRAQQGLTSSVGLLKQSVSEEIVLVGLHDALRFLDELTGETTPDDILSQVFATFCIGK